MPELVLLRSSELAVICCVTKKTIANWVALYDMPCSRTAGGHRRFCRIEVLQWMNGRDMKVPFELKEEGA